MTTPPQEKVIFGSPPTNFGDSEATKYLWVIGEFDIPLVQEHGDYGKTLNNNRACHTNLTGGAPAYCGGEIWFESNTKIFINGGSGRYPVESSEQLEDICKSLEDAEYQAHHMGWDEELNRPNRVWWEG